MRLFKDMEEAFSFVNLFAWGNAAGSCREPNFAIKCAQSGIKAVMFGSITSKPRVGNSGGDFYYDQQNGDSINACGLPNRGYQGYKKVLPKLKTQVNGCGANLWVSISSGDSFSPEEYHQMAEGLVEIAGADVIEANFSCPNVEVGGKRKPVVCFSPADFELGVASLCAGSGSLLTAVKIAPITEASLLSEIVEICLKYEVDYIVCSNTIGNCYMVNVDGKPALPGMIRGGMAGKCLRPLVSGMIQMIAPKLESRNTRIIAVGGIETGTDAYNYLCLGKGMVTGFQFNTALSQRGENLNFVEELILGKLNGEPGLAELIAKYGLPW